VTVTRFETSAVDTFGFVAPLSSRIRPIWVTFDAAGLIRANNLDRDKLLEQATGTTADMGTRGWETELTANLTPQWRLFANFSDEATKRTNIARSEFAYVANYRDLWLANGSRTMTDGTGRTVAQAVAALDEALYANFVLADGNLPVGQVKQKLNFRTNYEFAEGWMRGISAGGGARYLGPAVLGYFASGGLNAGVQKATYFGPEQWLLDFNIGYRGKLPRWSGANLRWSVQLNVNNVLNENDLVPVRVARDGQMTNYRIISPREWRLTTRFTF